MEAASIPVAKLASSPVPKCVHVATVGEDEAVAAACRDRDDAPAGEPADDRRLVALVQGAMTQPPAKPPVAVNLCSVRTCGGGVQVEATRDLSEARQAEDKAVGWVRTASPAPNE